MGCYLKKYKEIMTDPKKKNFDKEPKKKDELSSDTNAPNRPDEKKVDAIKTGNKKQAYSYDEPFDEQMYESFNDIREQDGEDAD